MMVKQPFDSLSQSIWMQDFESAVNWLKHCGRNQFWNCTYFRHASYWRTVSVTDWQYIFSEEQRFISTSIPHKEYLVSFLQEILQSSLNNPLFAWVSHKPCPEIKGKFKIAWAYNFHSMNNFLRIYEWRMEVL